MHFARIGDKFYKGDSEAKLWKQQALVVGSQVSSGHDGVKMFCLCLSHTVGEIILLTEDAELLIEASEGEMFGSIGNLPNSAKFNLPELDPKKDSDKFLTPQPPIVPNPEEIIDEVCTKLSNWTDISVVNDRAKAQAFSGLLTTDASLREHIASNVEDDLLRDPAPRPGEISFYGKFCFFLHTVHEMACSTKPFGKKKTQKKRTVKEVACARNSEDLAATSAISAQVVVGEDVPHIESAEITETIARGKSVGLKAACQDVGGSDKDVARSGEFEDTSGASVGAASQVKSIQQPSSPIGSPRLTVEDAAPVASITGSLSGGSSAAAAPSLAAASIAETSGIGGGGEGEGDYEEMSSNKYKAKKLDKRTGKKR